MTVGYLRTTWLVFGAQLRSLIPSKRLAICLVLAGLPVATALLLVFVLTAHDEAPPAFELGWLLLIQGIVPLIALILGSAVVAEEIEDRTITYLFTRPIPRSAVLVGRWLAMALVLELLIWASAELTFGILARASSGSHMGLSAGMAPGLRDAALLGGLVYSALFTTAGALLKHPMVVGIGYTFVVEGFIANLPGQNPTLTVQYHLKSHLAGRGSEIRERVLNLAFEQELSPPDEALRTLWLVLVVALAIGCWTVSRKQYVLPS